MFKFLVMLKKKNSLYAVLFMAPALAILLGLVFYPLARGAAMSLTNRLLNYINYSYIGFTNYFNVLHDAVFWQALWNSVKLTFWNVTGSLIIGLGLALLINATGKYKSWFRGLLFLPWAVPSIVVSVMFRWLYNDIYGFPNYFLVQHGLLAQAVNPLANAGTAWTAIIVPITWSYFPFAMLVFLSALQSVEPNLYKAAAIDGANRWQSFLHITLPALKSTILIVAILLSLWSFSEFSLVYLLTGGGPANATQTLSVYIYKQGFNSNFLGYASALGTAMFFILIVFTLLFSWVSKRNKADI